MFYEYALEPAVLSNWERVRYFLEAFGPWKGRFLAEYPRRWKKMVYASTVACPNVDRSRIEVKLRNLDPRVFSSRVTNTYDEKNGDWLDNAWVEHKRMAFHAVIAHETRGKPRFLDAAELGEHEPLWSVPPGAMVERTPQAFAAALALLFSVSKRVVLIDPYFRADQDDKTQPLTAFCSHLPGGATIEIHFDDAPLGYSACMKYAARALPDAVPAGMKVTLYCWKERTGGRRLHNRFVLTEVGGVQFGDSIEQGGSEQRDRLSIMDEASRAEVWAQFLGTPAAFEAVGNPREFAGIRGARK